MQVEGLHSSVWQKCISILCARLNLRGLSDRQTVISYQASLIVTAASQYSDTASGIENVCVTGGGATGQLSNAGAAGGGGGRPGMRNVATPMKSMMRAHRSFRMAHPMGGGGHSAVPKTFLNRSCGRAEGRRRGGTAEAHPMHCPPPPPPRRSGAHPHTPQPPGPRRCDLGGQGPLGPLTLGAHTPTSHHMSDRENGGGGAHNTTKPIHRRGVAVCRQAPAQGGREGGVATPAPGLPCGSGGGGGGQRCANGRSELAVVWPWDICCPFGPAPSGPWRGKPGHKGSPPLILVTLWGGGGG